jgi:hypothetical protein
MRQIQPYQTAWGARKALDNGGRFYNLWTQAGDNVIDSGELARAAGVHSSDMRAFLHFEMALMDLPEQQKAGRCYRRRSRLACRRAGPAYSSRRWWNLRGRPAFRPL